jgi:hypothetical protein
MKRLIVVLLLCTPLAGFAMNPVGTPMKRIVFANNIDGWQAVDKRRLILSTSPNKHYLVTLNRECLQLAFANHVGVSTSNNTIYSGFDHITVDGARFGIKTILEVSRAEVQALTSA